MEESGPFGCLSRGLQQTLMADQWWKGDLVVSGHADSEGACIPGMHIGGRGANGSCTDQGAAHPWLATCQALSLEAQPWYAGSRASYSDSLLDSLQVGTQRCFQLLSSRQGKPAWNFGGC